MGTWPGLRGTGLGPSYQGSMLGSETLGSAKWGEAQWGQWGWKVVGNEVSRPQRLRGMRKQERLRSKAGVSQPACALPSAQEGQLWGCALTPMHIKAHMHSMGTLTMHM